MEDTTLYQVLGVHGAALVVIIGWVIRALRNTPSRADLDKMEREVHKRIDKRATQQQVDDLKLLIQQHDEHNRADHREIRELLRERDRRDG